MKKLLLYGVMALAALGFLFSYFDIKIPVNETTKTCLVTGASSGIGAELSRQMVRKGWTVLGIARSEDKLNDLRKELGDELIPYACDVGKQEQIRKTSGKIKKDGHKPTLFFLNAGTGLPDVYNKFDTDKHRETLDVNYFGVTGWVEEWLGNVKDNGGGTFVVTSSVSALYATPGSAGYSMSKMAVNGCFRSLRLQYYNDYIGFVVVMPGPVQTGMLRIDKPLPFTQQPEEMAKYMIEKVFDGEQEIEPSWVYSLFLRILSLLPDRLALKLLV